MGDTTLTIDDDVKEQLGAYRHPAHDSWGDVLVTLMHVAPSHENVTDGCANCGIELPPDRPVDESGGVVQFFGTEYDGEMIYGSTFFCSAECAHENQQEINAQVPERPERVVVGGKAMPRAEFEDATFYLDRDMREVGIPVPGAFGGSDSHGEEYDYLGEPVYIYNENKWVQRGVVSELIHEESHTALILGRDIATEMYHHPDDSAREEYRDQHQQHTETECPNCGQGFIHPVGDPPVECGVCEADMGVAADE